MATKTTSNTPVKNVSPNKDASSHSVDEASLNIKKAIRVARELLQRSEMLRKEIAKNANSNYVAAQAAHAITPRLIKAMKSCSLQKGADDGASAESSVNNFFNEYREILQS